ncbi:MAG: hypothetical protein EXR84_10135 [Gammaproteobacteria bacterium]|nr:hypothetical protein [Gammaproteobacteria bacterium]
MINFESAGTAVIRLTLGKAFASTLVDDIVIFRCLAFKGGSISATDCASPEINVTNIVTTIMRHVKTIVTWQVKNSTQPQSSVAVCENAVKPWVVAAERILTTSTDCALTSVCRLAVVVERRSAQPGETGQILVGGKTPIHPYHRDSAQSGAAVAC